jgi:predicted metal-dependent phosphoesterase TrpH
VIADLHSHTTCSDGELTPPELVARAVERGVDVLAITDHDTVAACRSLPAVHPRLSLVHGVEFSTQWGSAGIHIVGLNIDPAGDAMNEAVRLQARARTDRARRIADNLEKKGVRHAYEGALRLSAGENPGRPHFARHLLETGRVDSIQAAFRKYLGAGKAGDVKLEWADMERVIGWIRDAGGTAVLAHPLQYRFTNTRLKRLLDVFTRSGGRAIEVISGQQSVQQTGFLARLCRERGLLASCGSDFHRPGFAWSELGSCAALPAGLKPVWDTF